ncbi:MAG: NUDIX domain-containing protein [Clostridiales bacterium]|nr:NUDIX domain-containing protein [Clostridiales bacterium]
MNSVKFYDNAEDETIKYAVIAARYKGKWVFCKHKSRNTYEIPGGHREAGENVLDTAKRELYEETGAVEFDIEPICIYKVDDYGMLYYANIQKFTDLPDFEMESVHFFDDLPDNLTHPSIQPALFKRAKQFLRTKK